MLRLSSRKFEKSNLGAKVSSQAWAYAETDANEFDINVSVNDSFENAQSDCKTTKKVSPDTSFALDRDTWKMSSNRTLENKLEFDLETSAYYGNTTDASSDDSSDESSFEKSSDSGRYVCKSIGVSNSVQNNTSTTVSQYDISCHVDHEGSRVDVQDMTRHLLGSLFNLNNTANKTNSSNISNDQENSEKPKKKTRRGGRKNKKNKTKAAGDQPVPATPATEEPKPKKEQVKFKTELWKNWIEKGKCSYSVRCRFAHGHHELVQNKEVERMQKNEKCETYHNQGFWTYGVRCLFYHDKRTNIQITQSYFGKSVTMMSENLANPCVLRKRLPIFNEIAPLAKLSKSSLNTVFISKKQRERVGIDEKAPISERLSLSCDSTDCNSESNDVSFGQVSAPSLSECDSFLSQPLADCAMIQNILQSMTDCTNFEMGTEEEPICNSLTSVKSN